MSIETTTIEKTDNKVNIENYNPKMYNVVILNDDVTHFDFVMSLLVNLFDHDEQSAFIITSEIHTKGRGIAGTYTYDIALQKKTESIELARFCNFPLQVIVEEAK